MNYLLLLKWWKIIGLNSQTKFFFPLVFSWSIFPLFSPSNTIWSKLACYWFVVYSLVNQELCHGYERWRTTKVVTPSAFYFYIVTENKSAESTKFYTRKKDLKRWRVSTKLAKRLHFFSGLYPNQTFRTKDPQPRKKISFCILLPHPLWFIDFYRFL